MALEQTINVLDPQGVQDLTLALFAKTELQIDSRILQELTENAKDNQVPSAVLVKALVDALEVKDTELSEKIDNIRSEVGDNIGTELEELTGRVDGLEVTTGDHDTRIDAVEGKADTNAADIISVNEAIAQLNATVSGLTHLKIKTVVGDINTVTEPQEDVLYFQKDNEEDKTWVLYIYKAAVVEDDVTISDAQWIAIGDTSIDLVDYWRKDDIDAMKEALGIQSATAMTSEQINAAVDAAFDNFAHVHIYTSAVTTEATCTTPGVMTYTCACGDTYTEEIPATWHTYDSHVVTDPTCTEVGYTTHTCSVCGHSYKDTEVAALGHDFGEFVVDVEATCDTAGSKSQHCSRCNAVQNVTEIPAWGHDYDEPTYEWNEDLTQCTAKRICVTDGAVDTETVDVVTTITVEATCTTNGERTYTAEFTNEVFGTQIKTEVIEAAGHNYVDGLCTRCGASEYFTFDAETGTITGLTDEGKAETELIVPASIEGTKVNRIGQSASNNNTNLTTLVISEGVTSIGDNAFYGCTSLTSVVIPEGVTSIGDNAFWGCALLTSVVIPESVTSIGDYAFCNCTSLTEVNLPSTIESIEYCAFYTCTSLSKVNLPEGLTSIGQWAFAKCPLTEVIIPKSLTFLGDSAFREANITTITIPDTLTTLEPGVFYYCGSLKEVIISSGIKETPSHLFRGCKSLKNVYIPLTLTKIDTLTFNECDSLTDIYYEGSQTNWNNIEIGTYNDVLNNVTIHYNYKK